MAIAGRCPICKKTTYDWDRHECQPRWHVILVDIDPFDEPRTIYAKDAEHAAEEAAECYDSGDYPLMSSSEEVEIIVLDRDMNNPIRFNVEPRMVSVYDATRSNNQVFDGVPLPEPEDTAP